MVFIDYASMDSANYTNVRCNNYQGGLIAGKYLRDTGHKKIMFLGNINYSYSFLQRYYGFCDYFKEKEDVEIFAVTECKENGLEKISERKILFDREKFREVYNENKCDAVMCANDKIAQEIYVYFQSMGIEIGKDVSVLGFDNLALCTKLRPGLSSVAVDRIELGLTAANAIRDLLLKSETLYSIEVNTKIIERKSVMKKGEGYEESNQ